MVKNIGLIILVTCAILAGPAAAAHAPEDEKLRVISLAPSSTEILFALGLDDEIVGVSQYCDYPEGVLTKERVGTFSRPDIEKIISLKPDVIFCTSLEQAPAVTRLRQLGFRICVSDPSTMEGLFASIDEIGGLVNKKDAARSLIDGMKAGIKGVADKVASVPETKRPKVYIEFWNKPIMTAGKGTLIDELITLAGGINIAADSGSRYSGYSPEDVVKHNPDCIIMSYMAYPGILDALKARFGWGDIAAIKNGRVYNDIDPDIILRAGPRSVKGLIEMHKRFYPDGI